MPLRSAAARPYWLNDRRLSGSNPRHPLGAAQSTRRQLLAAGPLPECRVGNALQLFSPRTARGENRHAINESADMMREGGRIRRSRQVALRFRAFEAPADGVLSGQPVLDQLAADRIRRVAASQGTMDAKTAQRIARIAVKFDGALQKLSDDFARRGRLKRLGTVFTVLRLVASEGKPE